jgi:hypothetical protein
MKAKRNLRRLNGDKLKAPKFKHSSTTYEGKIERAVFVFNDPHGLVADKMAFLKSKGLSDTEILEALNSATNGELLRSAGID